METQRVIFSTEETGRFGSEVKRRVAEYFESRGLSPKADIWMIVKTLAILTIAFGSYGLILTGWFPPPQMLGLAILMGIGTAGIGFCVAHDALHDAYSSNPRVNRLLGYTFDLIGANSYMWKITHNVIHHTYTNIHGVDEDLEVSALLRLSPGATRRPFHRFQHLYAFAAYALSTLNWVFLKDYKLFLRRDLGPFKNRRNPAREVFGLLGWKLAYYGYTIVVPLMVLEIAWWQFLIGFLAMHLTAGLILGVVFQLAHIVEDTEHLQPADDGSMSHAWVLHQMETTSDFARGNRWLSWYLGGLNFQVEHHLLPKVCSVHYPTISRIVQSLADAHGVPYHHHPTLAGAIRSHCFTLRRLGQPMPALAS